MPTQKKQTASDAIGELLKSAQGKTVPTEQTENLKKDKKPVRGKNGGARPGSGRKPKMEKLIERGIKSYIDTYVKEDVEVTAVDPKTGKSVKIKKPRVVVAMEHLYALGTGEEKKGNHSALSVWLDRALGKAPQPIKGDSEDDTAINVNHTGFDRMLRKVYGDDADAES